MRASEAGCARRMPGPQLSGCISWRFCHRDCRSGSRCQHCPACLAPVRDTSQFALPCRPWALRRWLPSAGCRCLPRPLPGCPASTLCSPTSVGAACTACAGCCLQGCSVLSFALLLQPGGAMRSCFCLEFRISVGKGKCKATAVDSSCVRSLATLMHARFLRSMFSFLAQPATAPKGSACATTIARSLTHTHTRRIGCRTAGDEQSLSASLSTFSGHLRRISALRAESGSRSLVLLDEVGTGARLRPSWHLMAPVW